MKQWLLGLLWLLLVYWVASQVPFWRVSTDYERLLSASAQQVLQQQDQLSIDVYADQASVAGQLVNNFLQPLVRQLPAVEVNYLDLSSNPSLAGQRQIQAQGEMVIRRGEQAFQLKTLSYEAFFNGLKRFDQSNTAWVVVLDGWQSKSMSNTAPQGLGQWLDSLRALNYAVVTLSWQPDLRLPEDVKALIIPAPQQALQQAAVDWLQQQWQRGVNLWWLTEPELAHVQPTLSLLFDVMPLDTYHSGHLIIKDLPQHPLNDQFDRPLDLVEVLPYQTLAQPLWLDTAGQVVASTQELEQRRLLVTGDGDFLSNTQLHSGGNLEMSVRLVDWLLGHDDRIDLPSVGLQQSQIHLDSRQILTFSGLMIILLPLLLLGLAVRIWIKHK